MCNSIYATVIKGDDTMTKSTKKLIFSLAFFSLTGGMFFLLNFYLKDVNNYSDGSPTVEKSLSKTEKIIKSDYKNLDCIRVINDSGEFKVNIEKTNNNISNYHIVGRDGIKIDDNLLEQSIIKNFVENILELAPMKEVNIPAEDLSNYGLNKDAKKSVIELYFNESKVKRLILGNESPLSIGYYLKDEDFENKVYLISQPSAELFFNPVESYFIKGSKGT